MSQKAAKPPAPPAHAAKASTLSGDLEDRTDPGIVLPTPVPSIPMPDLGALDALMKDPTVSEIMVNDLRGVMIEKDGKLSFSGLTLASLDELNRLVRSILTHSGRQLTADQPYIDVMLPDGSRCNIVGPPLTVQGPCVTIRKFPARRMSIEDLITAGALDRRMAYFLNACVAGRMNILVSGGTGSGKTTLLNALAALIPRSERIITIEDTPELHIPHINSVRLQTKPQEPAGPQAAGSPGVSARELVANSLRMRPDRILIGECRRGEAFDMLQAMNTGHEGSMTTIHANSPRDGISRIETLSMMAGVELPLPAVRRQIQSTLDLIVQIKRFRSGRRKIVSITEVVGMEGEMITLQDIFAFEVDMSTPGATSDQGRFKCMGFVPTFLERLRAQGIELPADYFA